jgi:hypothetical protein
MNKIKSLWLQVRSKPWFVAFEGGASGAGLNFIDDGLRSGHLDFSNGGLHKLAAAVLVGGITAVRLLYRQTPETPAK